MEDIFQIIIIIIFIAASIISSIKKKSKQNTPVAKPKRTPVPQQRPMQQRAKTNTAPKKQKTGAEILEQILGFKIELPEPPKKEAPNTSYDNSKTYDEIDSYDADNSLERTWNNKKYYEDRNEEVISEYQQKTDAVKDQLMRDKQKYKSKIPDIKFDKKNEDVFIEPHRIKKLISKKNNLKDYIIIQEVLNKPKALRK